MKHIHLSVKFFFFLILVFTGSLLTAQTHKVQKDGKFKNKHHKEADHHQRTEGKKKHHKTDFKHHSMDENKSFSKKKKKKAN